jgi:hypothetical protein
VDRVGGDMGGLSSGIDGHADDPDGWSHAPSVRACVRVVGGSKATLGRAHAPR